MCASLLSLQTSDFCQFFSKNFAYARVYEKDRGYSKSLLSYGKCKFFDEASACFTFFNLESRKHLSNRTKSRFYSIIMTISAFSNTQLLGKISNCSFPYFIKCDLFKERVSYSIKFGSNLLTSTNYQLNKSYIFFQLLLAFSYL